MAGLVAWAVSVPILGIDLTVGASPATVAITPLMVGVAALVPGALAWALLALLEILGRDAEPVRRGVAWLLARQDARGGFPAGAVNGVFFGTAMLDYRLYPTYFPAWALARAAAH